MFEKEDGLYLESLKNGKVSKIFLEKDIAVLEEKITKKVMEKIMEELK